MARENALQEAENEEQKGGHQQELKVELDRLEQSIEGLKVRYEQHFLGIIPIAPTKEHDELKRLIRNLLKAPYKSSATRFRLRSLETRYHTYNTYWEKVLRQREEGTYFRDVFKAEQRQKLAEEEARQGTAEGAASKQMVDLYRAYKDALEKQSGKKQEIEFKAFQKSVIARAKELKDTHGVKKVNFAIAVKNGKVTVQAKGKKE